MVYFIFIALIPLLNPSLHSVFDRLLEHAIEFHRPRVPILIQGFLEQLRGAGGFAIERGGAERRFLLNVIAEVEEFACSIKLVTIIAAGKS
jgi:hypothetical protein